MSRWKAFLVSLIVVILPTRIKRAMFHVSFHIARSEFDKFAYQYNFASDMSMGLAAMAKRGFLPRIIVDVGAFKGDWSLAVKRIWPDSNLIMIEPNDANHPELEEVASKLDARLLPELVGAEDGETVQFNIMGSGSSIMAERSAVARTVETRRLQTLDSLLSGVQGPGLLKIDAQGYELEILKGALTVLPAFEAVLLEIAVIEINERAPLLDEVIAFMRKLSFVTYDILEIHRRPLDGALNQVDIIFIREASKLIADKRHYAAN